MTSAAATVVPSGESFHVALVGSPNSGKTTLFNALTGARAKVGNIYVNRNQIGAIVGVQPFGGEGLSGTGPKAGGPRYLHRFATERTYTVDTTAAGGNATLFSLSEEGGW